METKKSNNYGSFLTTVFYTKKTPAEKKYFLPWFSHTEIQAMK